MIDHIGWVCTDCRSVLNSHNGKLWNMIMRLTEQLADVHVILAYMKAENEELEQNLCATADNTVDSDTETVSTAVMGKMGKTASTNTNSNNSDNSEHRHVEVSSASFDVDRTLTVMTQRDFVSIYKGLEHFH